MIRFRLYLASILPPSRYRRPCFLSSCTPGKPPFTSPNSPCNVHPCYIRLFDAFNRGMMTPRGWPDLSQSTSFLDTSLAAILCIAPLSSLISALPTDCVEVGIRKPIFLDTWEEPEEGGRICDVRVPPLASTASEEATDAAATISDDGA